MQAANVPDQSQAKFAEKRGRVPDGFWHAVLPYQDAGELAGIAASFVRSGVRAGAGVLIAAATVTLNILRAQLAAESSLITWTDISSTGRNPARLTALIRQFAAERADQPVWCLQEPAWPARTPEELCEVHRHEALLNVALTETQAQVLCPYDRRLGPAVLSLAGQTHAAMLNRARSEPSSGFAGGSVPAECDQDLPAPPAQAESLRYRDNLAAVRDFTAAWAVQARLSSRRVKDLIIAVSELAANTFGHTAGPGILTMWTTPGELICQVADGGQIGDRLAGTRGPDPTRVGGAGLWVVHQLCDLAEIRTGPAGTTIRLHMYS